MNNLDLSKHTIWLTGASRGIGRAISEKLALSKANLILSASNKDSFKGLISEFSQYSNIIFFPFDISNFDDVKRTHSRIQSIFGKVDILINNAGIGIFKKMIDITPEEFDRTMSVNFKGSFFCAQSVLPDMIKNQFGMIINISSIAAINSFPEGSIYGASKAALTSMSNCLREEVRQFGIKIIDILPGATETEIWDKDNLQQFGHRMMKPKDIADVVMSVIELNLNPRLITELVVVKPQSGNI